MVLLKRAYDPASVTDGHRVLVDRLWPRGLRKDAARVDDWLKDVAPSDELRIWFGHDPARFPEFRRRYMRELKAEPALAALADLTQRAMKGTVTLLFSARDVEHNNAVVLAEALALSLKRGGKAAPRGGVPVSTRSADAAARPARSARRSPKRPGRSG